VTTLFTIVCARCTLANQVSERYCAKCGLPLGALQADVEAGCDALEPYEVPEPADPDVARLIVEFVKRTRYDATAAGRGWQIVVPLTLDRRQAVYVGPAGTDAEGRALMTLVSVCGPVNDRDCRTLLKLKSLDPEALVRRVAERADGLEDRLSRGRDIY
jgi:hypothetical protein